MFENWTDRARKVMRLANEKALYLGVPYIGTEHVLMGLCVERSGIACQVLKNLDVDPIAVFEEVEAAIGAQWLAGEIPFEKLPVTPKARRVICYANDEAIRDGNSHVGTESVLCGLVLETEGVAAQILSRLGVTIDKVRQEIGFVRVKPEGNTYVSLTDARKSRDRRQTLEDERRVRAFHVGMNSMFQWMSSAVSGETPKYLPRIEGIPRDAILTDVRTDEWNKAFAFRILHESFDPVPMGQPTPSFGTVVSLVPVPTPMPGGWSHPYASQMQSVSEIGKRIEALILGESAVVSAVTAAAGMGEPIDSDFLSSLIGLPRPVAGEPVLQPPESTLAPDAPADEPTKVNFKEFL